MSGLQFYSGGRLHTFRGSTIGSLERRRASATRMGPMAAATAASVPAIVDSIDAQSKRLASRFQTLHESEVRVMPTRTEPDTGLITAMVPTETVFLEEVSKTELRWLKSEFGLETVAEGREGKILLRAPESGDAAITTAFEAARACFERGNVAAAHPNFLRLMRRPQPSSAGTDTPWHLDNSGNPGLFGADVHALAAWTITKGDASIRVAILDEGVDTDHTRLKPAVVAEKDFVDENNHARPDGDDAHGTACAGIVCSRDSRISGLAPEVSLVAARIAKGDGNGFWIFDDFATADAIDWCWEDAESDVLSNSWGGGPEVDGITRAFERARTQGRAGKGSVVVVAAGNSESPVFYPGTLPGVLTVGASNQWDKRKTKTSQDGEDWWGSNHGSTLDLLAPGVRIATTDIRGSHGYSSTMFTDTFNGTSSATPMVAACAALILSIRPDLTEGEVRDLITATADPLAPSGRRNNFVGHGRLNCYAALRAARRR
ncbi:MAG: S8 family serine peptidase [Maioricimonas sp. JB049]